MATVPHVTSGLGLRKFQADGYLLTWVYHQNQLVRQDYIKLLHSLVHQIRISVITSRGASAVSSQGIQRQIWKNKMMPPLITSELSCAILEQQHVCERRRCFTTIEVHIKWPGPYLVMVITVKSVTVGASRLDPISRRWNFSCGATWRPHDQSIHLRMHHYHLREEYRMFTWTASPNTRLRCNPTQSVTLTLS